MVEFWYSGDASFPRSGGLRDPSRACSTAAAPTPMEVMGAEEASGVAVARSAMSNDVGFRERGDDSHLGETPTI